jgi:hypothetical protein
MVSIVPMLALVLRTTEFVYHLLLSLVDRVSRLPRDTTVPRAGAVPLTSSLLDRKIKRVLCVARPSG